jgi:hypothetical protein
VFSQLNVIHEAVSSTALYAVDTCCFLNLSMPLSVNLDYKVPVVKTNCIGRMWPFAERVI